MPRMALCIFCGHAPAVNFALTALSGEPRERPRIMASNSPSAVPVLP